MREPTPESRRLDSLKPNSNPSWFQKWHDLAFIHWAYPEDEIARTLPDGLTVDTFDGYAWVGLVPFGMRGIRSRFSPSLPTLSSLLELNLRTYVYDKLGQTGVWFYSLDANSSLAVKVARRFFYLNYLHADITMDKIEGDGKVSIDYSCHRSGTIDDLMINLSYSAANHFLVAEPGTFEYFVLERYALYSRRMKDGYLHRGRVYHQPYAFAPATLESYDENIFVLNELTPPNRPPESVLYSPGVDVKIYSVKPV